MKKVISKLKINPSKYVNTETGETLHSENPNITSLNTYNKDLVIIDYKEYVIIDSKAITYITKHFSTTEVGRITKMADMVEGCFNILHNKNHNPHTDETLMLDIEYTRSKYSDFMKKLYKKGIIYYVTGYKNENPVKYILLNPYLARKTKAIHNDCLIYFDNFQTLEVKQKEK